MQFRTWTYAFAIAAGLGTSAMAQVTGKVTFEGTAPESKTIDMSAVKDCADQHADPVSEETLIVGDGGALKNVVISVKKEEGQDLGGEAPKKAVVLDQKGCMYSPHVIACMIGQDFLVKNDDTFMHNVHSLATANPTFNFAQSNKDDGKKIPEPLKTEETFKVKCDVHPWMLAWVRVFDHPFFAVTGDDGTYKIDGKLPDGEYTFVAWQESLPPQEQKATVKDGKAELNFTFKPASGQANPAPTSDAKLASDTTTGAKTMHCPACDSRADKITTASAKSN